VPQSSNELGHYENGKVRNGRQKRKEYREEIYE
jgi:hypothetical protein